MTIELSWKPGPPPPNNGKRYVCLDGMDNCYVTRTERTLMAVIAHLELPDYTPPKPPLPDHPKCFVGWLKSSRDTRDTYVRGVFTPRTERPFRCFSMLGEHWRSDESCFDDFRWLEDGQPLDGGQSK